jgi:uncharacterized protein (DUF2062 family)
MVIRSKQQFGLFPTKQKQFNLLRTIRYYYLRLVRLEGNPKVIARGLACGVFAGCFPWFGFQTIIGVLLAFIFRGNKLAAASGTWVSNPLTYAPLFFFNFKLGKLIQGNYSHVSTGFTLTDNWSQLMDLGTEVLVSLSIGSFVVGIVASIAVYFLTLNLLTRKQQRLQ